MRTDISKINEQTPHQDLTEGLMLFAGGTSKQFNTGEWRTGEESVVYFTRDLSAAGLKKIYDRIQSRITGKTGIKLHTGEKNGPNIIPRPWVKELMADKMENFIT